MLEASLFQSVLRILVVLLVPITGIVLGLSLLGNGVLSFFRIQDRVAVYTLRLLGVAIIVLLFSSPLTRFFLEEVRQILSVGG